MWNVTQGVWDELVGQQKAVAVLQRAVIGGRHAMSHSWLFVGPPGSGRSNAARAFAAALQCRLGGCGQCLDCRTALSGAHPDVTLLRTDPPSYAVAADIGRPWQLRPELGPTPATMQDLIELSEPGWLKYGMDFALHALDPGRIRVTTTTLCEPTGEAARRRFRPYWTLIRPFSGLIRRDMLQAVARGVGEVPGRCDER